MKIYLQKLYILFVVIIFYNKKFLNWKQLHTIWLICVHMYIL